MAGVRAVPAAAEGVSGTSGNASRTVDFKNHPIGIVLLSHAPPRGIGVSVSKEYFSRASNYDELPPRLTGRADSWINKSSGRMKFIWEVDESNTLENLDDLLNEDNLPHANGKSVGLG